MSEKTPHAQAMEIAEEVKAMLVGACYRIEVAGSLRRQKDEVKDVELVAIPRAKEDGGRACPLLTRVDNLTYDPDDMFSDASRPFRKAIYGEKESNRWGQLYRGLAYKGIKVELFLATPANWGCQFAIRTGPGENAPEVFRRMRLRGYCQAEGSLWKLRDGEKDSIVNCPDEETFFGAAGLPVLAPEERYIGAFDNFPL